MMNIDDDEDMMTTLLLSSPCTRHTPGDHCRTGKCDEEESSAQNKSVGRLEVSARLGDLTGHSGAKEDRGG